MRTAQTETALIAQYHRWFYQNHPQQIQPRRGQQLAQLTGFIDFNPLKPASHSQGLLRCLYELQQQLLKATQMAAISLSCDAGQMAKWQQQAGGRYVKSRYGRLADIQPQAATLWQLDFVTAFGLVSMLAVDPTLRDHIRLPRIEFDGDDYHSPPFYGNVAGLLQLYIDHAR